MVAGEARGGEPAHGGESALMCGFYVHLDLVISFIMAIGTWCCYWQFLILSRVFEETNVVSMLLCEVSGTSLPTLCRLPNTLLRI